MFWVEKIVKLHHSKRKLIVISIPHSLQKKEKNHLFIEDSFFEKKFKMKNSSNQNNSSGLI